jgi:hypothetical protein
MRELIKLIEQNEKPALDPNSIESVLTADLGLITKRKGPNIFVLADLPNKNKNDFRVQQMNQLAATLTKILGVQVKYNPTQTSLSTIGYVEILGSNAKIVVKDATIQGTNRHGVANEHQLVTLINQCIEQYGSVNVSFKDQAGKVLTGESITGASATGTDVKGGKKADVVLQGENRRIPISIKQVNAEVWESADSLFGKRAREILLKLMAEGKVELKQVGEREVRGELKPVYKISKEIVVEPTPEDAMRAIFGSDLNPEGGIIIQDFKPDHFIQKDNNITVECYAVITNKEDIPKSHLMYFLIKNFPGRAALGFYGVGTQAVTMTRAFGKQFTKTPIFVDQDGNTISMPKQLAEFFIREKR